jgi:hypothetical protein
MGVWVSLTKHLSTAGSPVRAFFEDRFPLTRGVASSVESVGAARALPVEATSYPWPLVGTAFDYRLRYSLAITPPSEFTAAAGARAVSGAAMLGYRELSQALDEFTSEHSPVGQRLSADREQELARLCLVLALYEQVYRAGPTPHWPIVRA